MNNKATLPTVGRITAVVGGFALLATLGGCAAGDAVMNHGDLDVETHMSESVFLDPVPPAKKTIYMSARNTSDHPEVNVKAPLAQALVDRGYVVVEDPDQAHYMLRINILQAGKLDAKDKAGLLGAKYGEPLLGGAIGAGVGGAMGGGVGAGIGGVVGLAGTAIVNGMYKDVLYSVVVDIQLSERPLSGAKVQTSTNSLSAQANGSASQSVTRSSKGATHSVDTSGSSNVNARSVSQHIDEEKDFKQYQIREVAYAEKVNLKFEEANPMLITRLTSTLSNLFE